MSAWDMWHVTSALLHGADKATSSAVKDLAGKGGDNQLRPDWYEYTDLDGKVYYWNEITGENTYSPPTQQLDSCLMYLRDRVGVPRDMGQAAALQLRAHLNWAIEILSTVWRLLASIPQNDGRVLLSRRQLQSLRQGNIATLTSQWALCLVLDRRNTWSFLCQNPSPHSSPLQKSLQLIH